MVSLVLGPYNTHASHLHRRNSGHEMYVTCNKERRQSCLKELPLESRTVKSSGKRTWTQTHKTRKVWPCLLGPTLIVLTLATVPTMLKFDRYKSSGRVRQIARTDANKAFLCECFSHFLHRAKTTFGLMHICWWRSSSHILMLWLRMSVRGGEKSNPWECPSHWGVISCLTISLQYLCPCFCHLRKTHQKRTFRFFKCLSQAGTHRIFHQHRSGFCEPSGCITFWTEWGLRKYTREHLVNK